MRCLDMNGAHPENDAVILVGILAGKIKRYIFQFSENKFYF